MATTTTTATSGPPFPLGKLTAAPWREQALTRIGEQRFVLSWLANEGAVAIPAEIKRTIEDHWDAAATAAKQRSRRGATVERVTSHLDAVDADLLRLAPASYVYGQLPGLLAQIDKVLPEGDIRRKRIEHLATQPGSTSLSPCDRDLIVAARHATSAEVRREVTRLRSFKNVLLVTAAVLAAGAVGLGVFASAWPEKLPMCFSPSGNIVCTTSTTAIPGAQDQGGAAGQPTMISPARIDEAMRDDASAWDIPIVEGVGLLAAALAAAASLRSIRGTSTPFSLPVALALLKLPTGALTAVLGLVLMRGEFIPGLSALDSSGQIISWAVVLGYSQQLLTRFVDQRAQTVLDNFGRSSADKKQTTTALDGTPATS